MIIKKIKSFTNTALFAVLVICCFSCDTDLYETYKEYSDGNVLSVAKPDSLTVIQGNGRLTLTMYLNADPKIKKGYITWNEGVSQEVFDINRTVFKHESVDIEVIEDEGAIEFTTFLEDASGNRSVKTTVLTTILGENYRASLSNRKLDRIELADTDASLTWQSNRATNVVTAVEFVVNNLLVETQITYTSSVDGTEQTIVVDESEDSAIIPNVQPGGTYSYKTIYKASVNSSDVFITDEIQGTFPN